MSRASTLALAFGLFALAPAEALADVAPLDSCTSAGQACTNAPPDYHTPGSCKASTCYRSMAAPDGGHQSVPYACTLCVAGGGTGGAGAGGGAGTGGNAGNAGATSGSGSGGDSGCACVVSPARAGGTIAALMLGIGALALFAGRRARRD